MIGVFFRMVQPNSVFVLDKIWLDQGFERKSVQPGLLPCAHFEAERSA